LRTITLFGPLRAYVEALVHPSVRADPLAAARHRSFIAARLIGVLAALAVLPVQFALRGAPTLYEAVALIWLLSPLIAIWDLSRTGAYERAHIISVVTFGVLIGGIASVTGGIHSFAAPWIAILPLASAVSATRRVAGFAILTTVAIAFGLWAAGYAGWLPDASQAASATPTLHLLGILSAALYAGAVGLGAGALTRLSEQAKLVGDARYRLLAQHMTDMITRHGKNGAVTFVSPAAEQLLAVPAIQLLGHGLFDRVHVADRPAFLTAIADAATKAKEVSVEYRLRHGPLASPEGKALEPQFIWVEMRCHVLQQGSIVAVTRDISGRKADALALESARTEAERANEAKSRFLATVSHELRTPLNAIIGFSEMLTHERDMQLDAARRIDYATIIRDSGEHLLGVVNGILDVSRIESDNFAIAPERFAIAPLVESCRDMMGLRAEQAGVRLSLELARGLPEIVADKRGVRQILLNLISNAIKFTGRGGSVDICARLEQGRLLLSVTDTGIGIAEADLERLGDPFFQVGSSYDRPYEGTGLGLSVVKGLVELHGGRVEFSSRLNEGTRVEVRLPLVCENTRPPAPSVIEQLEPRSVSSEPDKVKRRA
jgi:cell cycle sensor histidine kinase DivJ